MRKPDYPSADAARWSAVDRYFAGLLAPDDAVLAEALATNAQAGLPAYDVSALQGQMLALLVQITGARRVLEIGTLGGYSTLRMARALPALTGPYDLIFIDADKPNNPRYIEWALKLSRPGTVIVGDNVARVLA